MNKLRQTERVLKALANSRRLAILLYIKNHPESTVGSIAENIRLSFKATSKHLLILYSADLIKKEQRGLSIHYSLELPYSSIVKAIFNNL